MELINNPTNGACSLLLKVIVLLSEGYSRSCYKKSMHSQAEKHITLLLKAFQPLCYIKHSLEQESPLQAVVSSKGKNQTNLFNSVSEKKWAIDKAVYFD